MSQLHLVVVIDSKDGAMHVTTMDDAPVDAYEDVWDADHDRWRAPNKTEGRKLGRAERRLTAAIKAAGLA